jgi:hypothetical protein
MVGTNGSDARASPTVLRRRGRSPLSTCRCSFHAGGQLLLSYSGPVFSSSDNRSMSVVSAPFWHAAGMTSLEGV